MYSRLSETAAVDYKQLKEALLKRYELTENGMGSECDSEAVNRKTGRVRSSS